MATASSQVDAHDPSDVVVVKVGIGAQRTLDLADGIQALGRERTEEARRSRFVRTVSNDPGEPNGGPERGAPLAADDARHRGNVDAGSQCDLAQRHPAGSELECQPLPELDFVAVIHGQDRGAG